MKRAALVAAGALLLAAGVYLAVTRAGLLGEMAEQIAQNGERQLRETLRPARGAPRVVVFALDGVGHDILEEAVTSGGMPRLAALVGSASGEDGVYEHAYAVPGALSILPSTTIAAWSSVFTGEPPAITGVPGNEWFDRHSMRFSAPAPVSVASHEHTLEMLTDGLVGNTLDVPTLFERADVRSYVSIAPVYRGADLFTMPDPGLIAELFGAVAAGVLDDDPVDREAYASVDLASVDRVLETIERHGLADLQVVYFPAVDLFTHGADDALRQQAGYLREVIDPAMGAVVDAYARAGVLESTWFVIVSDHGHTPVLSDDRHALEAEGDDEPTAVLERAGFRLRPLVLEPGEDEQDYQAAVAYQGALAYIYLADRSTCERPGQTCAWSRPPRLEEDVVPVLRALDAANRSGEGVPALRGSLDLLMTRSQTDSGVSVWDADRLVPLGDYLARHPRSDLLRLEARMNGLVNGPHGHRAGDVILLARTGEGLPIDDRFYFSNRYRSWHGSPHAQDSRIPLWVARSGRTGEALRDRVDEILPADPSQLDVASLILSLLRR